MDVAFLTYEGIATDPVEIHLNLEKPVYILGKHFKPDEQMKEINDYILSKLWFTYRKNFLPIGGTGPISDTGWGCMLRCGQMILGQALVCRHLGREWYWQKDKRSEKYMKILKEFLDKKDSLYSIHQIAQMGVGEGKKVGQWFGPNTIAQVIRKLVLFDDETDLAVHVAMDNTVVIEDIKKLCKSNIDTWGCYDDCSQTHKSKKTPSSSCSHSDEECCNSSRKRKSLSRPPSQSEGQKKNLKWRPLLLFIPLRLGLSETNPAYFSSLKAMFTLKQNIGMIGGKPNHAHYFIGFNGDRLLYLDPHTTQLAIQIERYNCIPDSSYHCEAPCFMNFACLDPSIALGFYCHTEEEFDDWISAVKELIIDREKRPMFELSAKRPRHWPPFELPKRPCHDVDCTKTDFTELAYDYGEEEKNFDSSEEYEIL